MPVDSKKASAQWDRYAYARENGHKEYVDKYDICDAFFRGDQWNSEDKALLEANKRPALTINKIISTIGNVMGEQIFNRSEISFRPRSGAPDATAEILTKVFKQISDNNQLDWLRSDMFADGIISSRGYLDIRMDFSDNMQGEVRYTLLNPKNVIVDPDGEEMDPDTWNEVFTTKWVTAEDIAVLYGKADADLLKGRDSEFAYGYDSIDRIRDRFGDRNNPGYSGIYDGDQVLRNIRVVERQYRKLDRQEFFVSPTTGDMRPVPENWTQAHIGNVMQQFGLKLVTRLVRRIRWTVTADNVVLHDEWSPYKHFTIVPYFPYFRHGRTVGLVENLLGSQELLNKTSSQELHVINTTANSGWKIRTGGLTNMSVEELEQKGAQTGLVLELNELTDAEKILPNATPTGLDRVSYKAEEHIKSISGVSDSQMGQDRADVAAKAIQAKRQAGSTNLVKPLDSLVRTDYIIARNTLDLVQEYYTEERVLNITNSRAQQTETLTINQITAEGQVLNDLTVGEYDVVISSVPQRETLEDSQFDQAVSLKELGVAIPDDVLINSSRLLNKAEILKKLTGDQDSPEAQQRAELAMRMSVAEVEDLEADVINKRAEAGLKASKTQGEAVKTEKEAMTPIDAGTQGNPALDVAKAEAEADLEERKLALEAKKQADELQLKREQAQAQIMLQAQKQADDKVAQRIAAVKQAKQPAAQPQG